MVKKAPKQEHPPLFEKTLAELTDIVAALEKGDLSLEQSLQRFETGMAIAKQCQQALTQAEQKVNILIAQAEGDQLKPFEASAS